MHGLTLTETKKYTDYIPRYIEQMDKIVAETYRKTRGKQTYFALAKVFKKLMTKLQPGRKISLQLVFECPCL